MYFIFFCHSWKVIVYKKNVLGQNWGKRYCSSLSAEHIGLIKASSGNIELELWASTRFNIINDRYSETPCLLKYNDGDVILELQTALTYDEAIMGIDMETTANIFRDLDKRRWFETVIYNYMHMWESNA